MSYNDNRGSGRSGNPMRGAARRTYPTQAREDDARGNEKREGGSFGGNQPYGKKPYEKREGEPAAANGGNRSYGRKPYEKREGEPAANGGNRNYGRKPYEKREGEPAANGGNRSYGRKPYEKREGEPAANVGNRNYGRKPYEKREGEPAAANGGNRSFGRKPFERREGDSFGGGRSYGRKPYGRRENYDDAGSYGDSKPTGRLYGKKPPEARNVSEAGAENAESYRGNRAAYANRGGFEAATAGPRVGAIREDVPQPEQVGELNALAAEENENLLVGRNPIREALRAGRPVEKLMVAQGDLSGAARDIIRMARDAGAVVQEVERSRLDQIYPAHQGMLAFVAAVAYKTLDEIYAYAAEKGEDPFIVILDGITDPHNLGAIIRSAECAGAHGVVLPERRAAGLGPAAAKATAGAINFMRIARVKNLNRAIDEMKARGTWIIGTAMDGENALAADLTGPVALVIGSEGDGISHLTLEKCDRKLTLPMKGQIESLNASVAAGVLMYEVVRARAK